MHMASVSSCRKLLYLHSPPLCRDGVPVGRRHVFGGHVVAHGRGPVAPLGFNARGGAGACLEAVAAPRRPAVDEAAEVERVQSALGHVLVEGVVPRAPSQLAQANAARLRRGRAGVSGVEGVGRDVVVVHDVADDPVGVVAEGRPRRQRAHEVRDAHAIPEEWCLAKYVPADLLAGPGGPCVRAPDRPDEPPQGAPAEERAPPAEGEGEVHLHHGPAHEAAGPDPGFRAPAAADAPFEEPEVHVRVFVDEGEHVRDAPEPVSRVVAAHQGREGGRKPLLPAPPAHGRALLGEPLVTGDVAAERPPEGVGLQGLIRAGPRG
mmetsp:Transcript_3934/g.11623  ORF Transcript_3934/g.11623 Transcript_3934/m.11623 type:complete len:320 (+) Transcript_3934:1174-2133(+)